VAAGFGSGLDPGGLKGSLQRHGQRMGWRLPVWGLAWWRVQLLRDAIELCLRHGAEVHRAGQVLSQKPVRVLVATSLPWGVGRIGTPGDNAMMESFVATVQHEVLDPRRWRSRDELRRALFVFLEITYNRERRHSSLGYRAPTEFNTEARAKLTNVH